MHRDLRLTLRDIAHDGIQIVIDEHGLDLRWRLRKADRFAEFMTAHDLPESEVCRQLEIAWTKIAPSLAATMPGPGRDG